MQTGEWLKNIDVGRAIELLGIEAAYHGDQWHGHCPNSKLGHPKGDRHPSWAIRDNPSHDRHGVHGCWSCSYRGTIVGLVRDMLHMPSNEDGLEQAEKWLLEHARRDQRFAPLNVSIEVADSAFGDSIPVPVGVRLQPLEEWSTPPRRYWLTRGFDASDVQTWHIGWAAQGRCAGRIWIPIHNREGHLVSWNARAFDGRSPKYLRAGDGDTIVMFGEHTWPIITRREVLAISEGELNVIAAKKILGDEIALGAVSGNKMMRERQMLRLLSFPIVIILADPDQAGAELTEAVQAVHPDARVAKLPDGSDSAKLLQEGKGDVLRAAVQKALGSKGP